MYASPYVYVHVEGREGNLVCCYPGAIYLFGFWVTSLSLAWNVPTQAKLDGLASKPQWPVCLCLPTTGVKTKSPCLT